MTPTDILLLKTEQCFAPDLTTFSVHPAAYLEIKTSLHQCVVDENINRLIEQRLHASYHQATKTIMDKLSSGLILRLTG